MATRSFQQIAPLVRSFRVTSNNSGNFLGFLRSIPCDYLFPNLSSVAINVVPGTLGLPFDKLLPPTLREMTLIYDTVFSVCMTLRYLEQFDLRLTAFHLISQDHYVDLVQIPERLLLNPCMTSLWLRRTRIPYTQFVDVLQLHSLRTLDIYLPHAWASCTLPKAMLGSLTALGIQWESCAVSGIVVQILSLTHFSRQLQTLELSMSFDCKADCVEATLLIVGSLPQLRDVAFTFGKIIGEQTCVITVHPCILRPLMKGCTLTRLSLIGMIIQPPHELAEMIVTYQPLLEHLQVSSLCASTAPPTSVFDWQDIQCILTVCLHLRHLSVPFQIDWDREEDVPPSAPPQCPHHLTFSMLYMTICFGTRDCVCAFVRTLRRNVDVQPFAPDFHHESQPEDSN